MRVSASLGDSVRVVRSARVKNIARSTVSVVLGFRGFVIYLTIRLDGITLSDSVLAFPSPRAASSGGAWAPGSRQGSPQGISGFFLGFAGGSSPSLLVRSPPSQWVGGVRSYRETSWEVLPTGYQPKLSFRFAKRRKAVWAGPLPCLSRLGPKSGYLTLQATSL